MVSLGEVVLLLAVLSDEADEVWALDAEGEEAEEEEDEEAEEAQTVVHSVKPFRCEQVSSWQWKWTVAPCPEWRRGNGPPVSPGLYMDLCKGSLRCGRCFRHGG